MNILDPKQQEELDKLNKALSNQSLQPEDKKLLRKKMFFLKKILLSKTLQ